MEYWCKGSKKYCSTLDRFIFYEMSVSCIAFINYKKIHVFANMFIRDNCLREI